MRISSIRSGVIFGGGRVLSWQLVLQSRKCILNSDCIIILPVVWIKNTAENVD